MAQAKVNPKTTTLANMLADVNYLMAAIQAASETQDLDNAEAAQAFIESVLIPAIEKKTDAMAYVIKFHLPTKIAELREYADAINQVRKSYELQLESLKGYLKLLYQTGKLDNLLTEDNTLEGQQHSLSFTTTDTPAITVQDGAQNLLWSPEEQEDYAETEIAVKPIKAKLAEAYKQGKPLPPGVTATPVTKLSVKTKK